MKLAHARPRRSPMELLSKAARLKDDIRRMEESPGILVEKHTDPGQGRGAFYIDFRKVHLKLVEARRATCHRT
jgi:hypothetical protein